MMESFCQTLQQALFSSGSCEDHGSSQLHADYLEVILFNSIFKGM